MATSFKRRQQYMRAIRNREAFKSSTGSLWAQWENDGMRYVVYSYKQWIADYTYGVWCENRFKYSATTSHHQHIVAMAIDPNYPLGD